MFKIKNPDPIARKTRESSFESKLGNEKKETKIYSGVKEEYNEWIK